MCLKNCGRAKFGRGKRKEQKTEGDWNMLTNASDSEVAPGLAVFSQKPLPVFLHSTIAASPFTEMAPLKELAFGNGRHKGGYRWVPRQTLKIENRKG